MAAKETEGFPALIALRAAVARGYTAATHRSTTDTRKLNQLARIVAARVPIFARSTQAEPVRLLASDIQEGRFQKGGEQLGFADGRAPLTGLAIQQNQLPMAIAAVLEFYRSDSK